MFITPYLKDGRFASTHHTNEDIAGSIQGLYCGSTHGQLHDPGYLDHYELHQPPVVEYADYCTEVDHCRKYLKIHTHNFGGVFFLPRCYYKIRCGARNHQEVTRPFDVIRTMKNQGCLSYLIIIKSTG